MIYIILFVGLFLRLISLNQSLWLDEATTALAAKMSLSNLFTKFLPGDFHPPLYYVLMHFWSSIFGQSEISLRVPSIIFSLLTIYTTFLIGKKVFGKKIGLMASAFLAISGLAVYYSQEARMYSLAAFLVSYLIYLFLEKKGFLFSIVLLAVGLTDYVALLVVPIFWLLDHGNWKRLTLVHLPLIAAFSVWLPLFVRQLAGGLSLGNSNWWNILGPPTFKNIALIPVKFIFGRISFDNKLLYGLTSGAVGLFFGWLLYKAREASKIILLWLVVPVCLGVLISFKIPALSYFRFLFCLPAFYLLVASGIGRLGKFGRYAFVFVLAINLLSTGYYLLSVRFQREDWRAAAKALGSGKVVFPSDSQKEALIYYSKQENVISVDGLTKNYREIWLSRYVWEISDPKDFTRKKVESLGYNKTFEYNFNGVAFWKYAR